MTVSRRVGILGGTFDPIHVGHLDLGQAAETALNLTRVFVVPAHIPPHRSEPTASSYHRFAMVALALAGRPRWQGLDVELRSQSPSYTTDTLRHFHEWGFASSELFFLTGADAFLEIATWKDYPGILNRAHFVVVSRPGCSIDELPRRMPTLASRMTRAPIDDQQTDAPGIFLIDAATADVSATAIRGRRAEGQPIAGLVVPAVQQHIEQHDLYSPEIPGRRTQEKSTGPAAGRLHGHS
jgi:nicotinate-nucleotide adenylyltransferase